MKNALLIIGILIISLAGCSAGYVVSADSIMFKANADKQYVMLSMVNGVGMDHPRFKEYSRYVERALRYHGYERVRNENEAGTAVMLFYGIGAPEIRERTYAEPVYGFTRGGHVQYDIATQGPEGTTFQSSTIYIQPRYSVVGADVWTLQEAYYLKTIVLEAYDLRTFRKTGKKALLWRTYVSSKGPQDTIREAFPYIVAGALEFFGTNDTGRRSIGTRNTKAQYIKGLRDMTK